MKKLLLVIAFLFIASNLFADKICIPFSVYPQKLQEAYKRNGLKLDLSGNDRTEDSFGFIENKGQEYVIYTYKPVSKEILELTLKIAMENN